MVVGSRGDMLSLSSLCIPPPPLSLSLTHTFIHTRYLSLAANHLQNQCHVSRPQRINYSVRLNWSSSPTLSVPRYILDTVCFSEKRRACMPPEVRQDYERFSYVGLVNMKYSAQQLYGTVALLPLPTWSLPAAVGSPSPTVDRSWKGYFSRTLYSLHHF